MLPGVCCLFIFCAANPRGKEICVPDTPPTNQARLASLHEPNHPFFSFSAPFSLAGLPYIAARSSSNPPPFPTLPTNLFLPFADLPQRTKGASGHLEAAPAPAYRVCVCVVLPLCVSMQRPRGEG